MAARTHQRWDRIVVDVTVICFYLGEMFAVVYYT